MRDILNGAVRYWHRHVLTRRRGAIVFLAFFLGVALLLAFLAPPLFLVGWVVFGMAFVVGDIMEKTVQVARCPHCGILINPAPAYRTACPVCRKTVPGI